MGIDIGGAFNAARTWTGDRLDDVDALKDKAGGMIDNAVHGAEDGIDGFREGLVDFGREHGGVVGETVAQGVSNTLGAAEGGVLAVYDMGKGVVTLADGASKLINPLEWATHGDRNLQRLESATTAASTVGNLANPVAWVADPGANVDTAKALWNGVTAGYQDAAANGDWSKFAGRAVVDVGSLFIGVGEANAAIKGSQGANALAHGAEGARALDGVADGARALDAAGDAGRAANLGDELLVRAGDAVPATLKDDVLAIAKGSRPEPSTYLSPTYISEHLAQFEGGATKFTTQNTLDKYGIAQRDGTAFVMPKAEADALVASAHGDPALLEQALGLPAGTLENNPLVRVDIPNPADNGLRIPSGNEAGANDLWIPGGKLPDGNAEAVIDAGAIPPSGYATSPVPVQ